MYKEIRSELDETYKIKDKTFRYEKNTFTVNGKGDIRINPKTKNFLKIIRALSEKGYCTSKEIAQKYDLNDKKGIKNRQNIYFRSMTGEKKGEVLGLIKKGIIEPENSDWENKK